MKFIIGHELAQAILNYLQTKPYAEVSVLIGELIKLQQLEAPAAEFGSKEKEAEGK